MGQAVRSLLLAATAACLLLPVAATAAAGAGSGAPAHAPSVRPPGATLAPQQEAADPPDAVPGELLVRFRAGATADERAEVRADVDARLLDRLPVPGLQLLQTGPDAAATARALERRPDVLYAEPNYVATVAATPNDPQLRYLWGLHNTGQTVEGRVGTADADIDAPEAWDRVIGRPGVTVAVVDTGVATDHPDVAANIWSNSREVAGNRVDDDLNGYVDDVRGWDWVDDDADPYDRNGHGTHVAGTVGAVGDNGVGVTGVAWDVSLMPLRVLGTDGYGSYADIVEAFSYAGSRGADVVNASLGGPDRSLAMADVIARYPQTLFVTAAGNAGSDNDATADYPCNYPDANVVCVAATDNRNTLADFSNYGATSVDLAAPGVSILSTVPPEETVRRELFEDTGWSTRWTSGGTATWSLETDEYGDFASDSPGGQYAPGTDTWLQTTTPLDLRGGRNCTVDYWLSVDVEPGYDFFHLEASSDGTSWRRLSSWSDSSGGWLPARDELRPFDGQSSVHLRFRLTSDALVQGDGAKIDDVAVACQYAYDGDEYAFYDGTSMASPQVAGAAALLVAANPAASVAEVRDALLTGVDPLASLRDKTVTGGRLNVRNALDLLPRDTTPPETAVVTAPESEATARTATFAFSATEDPAAFECSLDGEPFTACTSPVQYSELTPGAHDFAVRAQDVAGNVDPTAAQHRWTVENTAPTDVRVGGFASPVTTRISLPLRLSATDADDAIDHFEVRHRTARYDGAYGAWSTLDSSVPSGEGLQVPVPTGHTVCYSARATDVHGATSAWGPSRCTAVPVDDRGLTRSAGWDTPADRSAFRRTLTVNSRRGARLAVADAVVRRIALVATRAPGSGTVAVHLGNTLLRRISLAAPTIRKRQVIPVAAWAKARTGAVRVVVTSSGRPVRVDGLALGR